jgi:hypothetical protein
VSRFPVAFRPPAFASRSSDSHRGIGPSSRSAYRPTAGPRRGYRVPHARARTGVGAPSTPRTTVLIPTKPFSLAGACRFTAASPLTPLQHPPRGASLLEASTRVQAIHPSGLPLAWRPPDGTGDPFGFPPSFAPRRPGAGQRTSGWGQAIEHGPETRSTTSHQPSLQSRIHSMRATSRRTNDLERLERVSAEYRRRTKARASRSRASFLLFAKSEILRWQRTPGRPRPRANWKQWRRLELRLETTPHIGNSVSAYSVVVV